MPTFLSRKSPRVTPLQIALQPWKTYVNKRFLFSILSGELPPMLGHAGRALHERTPADNLARLCAESTAIRRCILTGVSSASNPSTRKEA